MMRAAPRPGTGLSSRSSPECEPSPHPASQRTRRQRRPHPPFGQPRHRPAQPDRPAPGPALGPPSRPGTQRQQLCLTDTIPGRPPPPACRPAQTAQARSSPAASSHLRRPQCQQGPHRGRAEGSAPSPSRSPARKRPQTSRDGTSPLTSWPLWQHSSPPHTPSSSKAATETRNHHPAENDPCRDRAAHPRNGRRPGSALALHPCLRGFLGPLAGIGPPTDRQTG